VSIRQGIVSGSSAICKESRLGHGYQTLAHASANLDTQHDKADAQLEFREHLEDFERQRREMEKDLGSVSIEPLAPKVRFRFTTAGLELLLRYRVESGTAAEMDRCITEALLCAVDQEPKLKIVGAEIPAIQIRKNPIER
jgi:hypothetical protein